MTCTDGDGGPYPVNLSGPGRMEKFLEDRKKAVEYFRELKPQHDLMIIEALYKKGVFKLSE